MKLTINSYTFGVFISLLFIFPQASFSQEKININKDFLFKSIEKQEVLFFRDTTGSLTIEDISKPTYQKKFSMPESNGLNFGFTTEVYWLKMKLKKDKTNPYTSYFLEFTYPLIDTVSFYTKNEKQIWQRKTLGDNIAFEDRTFEHQNFVFVVNFSTNTTQTVYLRLHTKGAVSASMVLRSMSSLQTSQVNDNLLFGILYGGLFILGVYNLFLFFPLRDSTYLLYAVSIFVNLLSLASGSGHTLRYFWGNYPSWSNPLFLSTFYLNIAFAVWFSVRFLWLGKYQKNAYYVSFVLIGGVFSLSLLSFFLDYNSLAQLISPVTLLCIAFILYIAVYTWLKGNTSARFFILAWFVYLATALILVLSRMSIIPYLDSLNVSHGIQVGAVAQVVLLSFALADRINIYRRKTVEAQSLALEKSRENEQLVREQNETLEQKVLERTHELSEANQELIAQEEELRQNMEELQAIQETLEIQNKHIAAQSKQTRNSIRAAQTIQEAILPYQGKFDKFFEEYFIINKPKDVVSGDFYWLSKVENKTVLCVADCTGHGVPGAFMTLIGTNLLDKIVKLSKVTQAADILKNLHREIQHLLKQKYNNNNNGMDAIVITLEQGECGKVKLTFAGAKNNLRYYHENELRELKATRKSIGGIQNEKIQFANQSVILNRGDLVYLGSDGLEDQNNVKRKRFGSKYLKELTVQNINLELETQKEKVEEALTKHMQDTEQRDDILWIGFKV